MCLPVSAPPSLLSCALTSLPLEVSHVLVRLQGWVTENGLWGSAGWWPEERVWAEPRRPNGQYVGAGEGFVYSINVVPRDARALVTQKLWQDKKGGSRVRSTRPPHL